MSRKILKLCLIAFAIGFLNCAHKNGAPMERTSSLQKIYIDAVEPQQLLGAADQLNVKVQGNLPNPSYTFDRFDVVVKKNLIEITPLAKHDTDKIVMQVLVPFEQVCEVKNLKPGKYEIKVIGRSESVVSKERVEVKQ